MLRFSAFNAAKRAVSSAPSQRTASVLAQRFPTALKTSEPCRISAAAARSYHTPTFANSQRTLSQRLFYRKDGTSRSKLKGALYVTGLALLTLTLSEMVEIIDELNHTCFALEFLYQAKAIDRRFTVDTAHDLAQIDDAAAYFFELFRPFMVVEGGSLEDAYKVLLQDELLRDALHDIILDTTARIHRILNEEDELKSVVPVMELAWEVNDVWVEALEKMQQMATALAFNKTVPTTSRSDRRERKLEKEKGKHKDFEVVE